VKRRQPDYAEFNHSMREILQRQSWFSEAYSVWNRHNHGVGMMPEVVNSWWTTPLVHHAHHQTQLSPGVA
jgi:hypothetical protein